MALIPWKGLEKCTNQPVTSPSGFSKCQGRNAFKIAFQGSTSDTVAWLWGGEERDNTPGSCQRTCDGHQVLELPHLFVGKETPLPTKVGATCQATLLEVLGRHRRALLLHLGLAEHRHPDHTSPQQWALG